MLSFFCVEDVIILHCVNILILSVEDVINFLGLIVIVFKVLYVIIFHSQQM